MDLGGGQILIDGQDIAQAKQSDLRKSLSYVPQDPAMFHRSLAENIAYGKQDAKDNEIERIAQAAHADEFIKYEVIVLVVERPGVKRFRRSAPAGSDCEGYDKECSNSDFG